MVPRKPQRQKKRRKKRWRSAAEIEVAEITKIRQAIKRVGGKEQYYHLVELALQQPAGKVGRPAAWRDDRLLLHLEWLYRHRPRGSRKTRNELTREFVKALWDDPAAATGWLKGTAISKQAATARLYGKWRKSGYGKLPAEELSDAHVRLVMGRMPPFDASLLSVSECDGLLPFAWGRSRMIPGTQAPQGNGNALPETKPERTLDAGADRAGQGELD